jgi:hypothetical protein
MFISKMFETCFEIFLSLSLSLSFLFLKFGGKKKKRSTQKKQKEISKEAQPNPCNPPSPPFLLSPSSFVRQRIRRSTSPWLRWDGSKRASQSYKNLLVALVLQP